MWFGYGNLFQYSQSGVVVWFVFDFRNQLGMQYFVVFVENDNGVCGQVCQWVVDDGNVVVFGEVGVMEG